ncbi:hypothetical protein H6P81_017495 [Aristolochia fimbriata]|uniref:Leucine-rich repeat-containing N-terminal plant-type domain-containing protein n=1 Tax=Aristolochia fimbriata TaxID=158543 RepID=A0AAV7E178_ARIFI|nr:hypothetical protein H6P81_017495 [Aristolochia fimbriata]
MALTLFKNALNDPSDRFSSWDTQENPDCCKWRGITCDKKTGYVIKLDLRSPYQFYDGSWRSELDQSALMELKHLRYVDLSCNNFYGNSIPAILGSLSELRYLNLSYAHFQGIIPPQLGNLSKLEYLDVSSSRSLAIDNLVWLERMESLKYLNMDTVNLSRAKTDWLHTLNRLPSLIEIHLVYCELSRIPLTLPVVNFTSLRVLHLSWNGFHLKVPNWIANLSNLVSLDLSWNSFSGPITSLFSRSHEGSQWRNIKRVILLRNQIQGEIPEYIGNLTSLVELDLSDNQISGSIPESISGLKNLQRLYLSGNNINGGFIDQLCSLRGLEYLDLSSTNLSGSLPKTLGQLSELRELRIGNNSLTGIVSEVHFRNLSKVTILDMSYSALILQFQKDWSPPFQLSEIYLRSCHLGPDFPSWLKSQKDSIRVLDISNSSIADEVPDWFWEVTPQLDRLLASNNKMRGNLPDPFMTRSLEDATIGIIVDLSSNLFSGPIPSLIGFLYLINLSDNKFSGSLTNQLDHPNLKLINFVASNNNINGTIPSSIEGLSELQLLDLSRNNLSGTIPATVGYYERLHMLDLSENSLHGEIPEFEGEMQELLILHLYKNKLSGGIPNSLKECSNLEALDLGENNFSGNIPAWIGDLANLRRLRLRSNFFSGKIPLQLSNARSLQILDLADNMLTGSIPPSFGNLLAMKLQNYTYGIAGYTAGLIPYFGYKYQVYGDDLLVSAKGQMLEFTTTLSLVTSLDLSNNNLEGDLPEDLTKLIGLHFLNFSGNHFTGKISENIINLNLLESLDLSRNQFFGLIPQSLSYMTSLGHLNLSYNNFSGKIPSGQQLQVLDDASSYIGNAQLCGPPLMKKCAGDIDLNHGDKTNSGNEEKENMGWLLYAGIGPGFGVGCSGILLVLIFKKSWSILLFRFADAFSAKFFP